ncbi:MAG: DUF2254 domain-containing protein [wastewater metagenome]|nr:DUF2254 domain-containing protein [Candidatus Loosdrechtia aerotolerans]
MEKLRQYWYNVHSSFWFIPGLIIIVSIALAIGLIKADPFIDRQMLDRWPRLFGVGVEGSRALLEAIASSMITVAGTVFSITLVALALASSQYTSRVLRTFMRNRVNQTVLGMFVGIFAYCLVVLRTIQGEDTGEVFVPSLAVLFGMVLGFIGIAFLILFIHNIAVSIQASHIIADVSEETLKAVNHLFPEEVIGVEDTGDRWPGPDYEGQVWRIVPATETGYIQQIDIDVLLSFAEERGVLVRVEQGIGEFLVEGTPAVSILTTNLLNEKDVRRLGSVYTVGKERSMDQDVSFGIRQLVDMALRALSPGINDTTTAIMCINYLTAILVCLINRRIESCYRTADGRVRVLARGPTFAGLMMESFDQIRQNAGGNVAVLTRMLQSLETLADSTLIATRRRVLLDHAKAVVELGHRSVPSPSDRQYIISQSARLITTLDTQ